jgi:hypothetical protein
MACSGSAVISALLDRPNRQSGVEKAQGFKRLLAESMFCLAVAPKACNASSAWANALRVRGPRDRTSLPRSADTDYDVFAR